MKKNVMMFIMAAMFAVSGAAIAQDHGDRGDGEHAACSGDGYPGCSGKHGKDGKDGKDGDTGTVDTTLLTNEVNTRISEVARLDSVNFEQDARLSGLEQDVSQLRGGVAMAVAAASHQYDLSHTGLQGSMAVGYYNGDSALSVGMGGKIDANVFVNVNYSTTSHNRAVGGAVGFKF